MPLLSGRGARAAFIVCAPVIAVACVLTACGGGGSAQSTLPSASSGLDPQSGTTATGLTVADANSAWTWAAPLTLAWPKGAPASGDVLIACADANIANTPAAPAGWTALYATSAGRKGTALFYRIAGPKEPAAVVFAIPHPYNVGAAMVRVTGAGATAPIWSHTTNAGTGSITTAAVVPNVVGMLPLACFASVTAGEPTNAAGWTIDTREGQYYSALFEQRQSLTPNTTTGISVTSIDTAPASSTVNDAYGLLVAPAGVTEGGLTLTPASIAFGGVKAPAQTVTVTQTGNTSFTANSQNCSTVATVLGQGGGKFNVAPVGVGTCTVTIAGAAGATIALPVSTTATVLNLN